MNTRMIARVYGLCVCVVGCCILILLGYSLMDVLAMIGTIIASVFKLAITLFAFAVALVGAIWVIRPQRALDAIERNRAHRKLVEDAKRD
jgi:membrane protein DedA with SNARE-associated domain